MMGTDEIQVAEFLKTAPNSAVTAREIARRVGGKKRLREDPDWIRPVIRRLLMDELIEADEFGQYRLKMRENSNATPTKLTMENFETWQLVLDETEASEQSSQTSHRSKN